jgi:hypothetical protein
MRNEKNINNALDIYIHMKRIELKQIIKEVIFSVIKEGELPLSISKLSKHWWLDPDLEAHEVPFERHREWAINYLKRMGHDIDPDSSDVYSMMYRYGFIHIVKVDYPESNVLHYGHSKFNPINHRQLAAIKNLAIKEDCKYISDTNTGREEELQESMFPKDFNRHNLGTCMSAAALATQYFLQKGIKNFKIVEGWVYFPDFYDIDDKDNWSTHTWIEFDDGRKFDPTKNQWKQWGFNPSKGEVEYVPNKINKSYTPQEYLKIFQEIVKEIRLEPPVDNEVRETTNDAQRKAKEYQVKQYLSRLNDGTIVVTVNKDPTFPAADFIQIDGIVDGQNIFSSNPEDLAKWGFKMPSTKELMTLPRGKYKLSDAKKLLQRGLQENMTYDQLLKLTADTPRSPDTNTNRIDRSKNVRVRSIPVSVEEGMEQWNFRYRSDRTTGDPGEPLQGHITFIKGEVQSKDQAAELECKVDCSCPDYRYKFAHNNFKQGAGDIGPKSLNKAINRSPKPAYDIGEGLCKHLSALSGYLQTKIGHTQKSNLFEAVSDIARQGPFNITYYDD